MPTVKLAFLLFFRLGLGLRCFAATATTLPPRLVIWLVTLTPPAHVLAANRIKDGHADIGMFQANWARAVAYLGNAKAHAGEMYAERKRALDELVDSTTRSAQTIAKMAPKEAARRIASIAPKPVVD